MTIPTTAAATTAATKPPRPAASVKDGTWGEFVGMRVGSRPRHVRNRRKAPRIRCENSHSVKFGAVAPLVGLLAPRDPRDVRRHRARVAPTQQTGLHDAVDRAGAQRAADSS